MIDDGAMKAAFYTLGCKVNQYETESMREQFRQAGFSVVSEDEAADVYVVNTCTVTNLADRKSRQYIRKAHRLNPDAVVAVTGCYAQMDKDAVAAIEGVDIVTGTDEKSKILGLVQEVLDKKSENQSAGNDAVHNVTGQARGEDSSAISGEDSSAISGADVTGPNRGAKSEDAAGEIDGPVRGAEYCDVKPYEQLNKYEELGVISEMEGRTRAFIKIQEGCDRFCSYCIIPFARGKVRSRDRDEIVREVRGLVDHGYREIVLTGINTALYGTDLGYGGIAPLIEALDQMGDAADESRGMDFRIRLSSLEPTVVDADYAVGLLKYERLCHHLHLSAQSGSDHVLDLMNRHYTREEYLDIVRRLREEDPYYGISADIIVGFPGETEEDFRKSVELVRESELVKTHVFKYSVRRGTRAAGMTDQVDEKIKNQRSKVLIDVAEEVQRAFLEKCRGTVRRVLFEQEEDGMVIGYTDNYIKVYVPAEAVLMDANQAPATAAYQDVNQAPAEAQFEGTQCQAAVGQFAWVRLGEPYCDGVLGELTGDSQAGSL